MKRMTLRAYRLKPANGFAHYVHLLLTLLLPLVLFVLVKIAFVPLAIVVVLMSKWRIFAVRPRYWFTYVRSNAIDILVGVSIVIFMAHTLSTNWQLGWAAAYSLWLLAIKPRSDTLSVMMQALIGQAFALSALFFAWQEAPLLGLVLAVALIAYLAARHFFTAFDEDYGLLYTYIWTYFAAALAWVLAHWLLFYLGGMVAQVTLLLSVLGTGLGTLYYLDETERLSALLRRQFIAIMVAVVVVVIGFSNWGDRTL